MSYENEIKFVARGYRELEEQLTPFRWCDIEQGYLNPNNRVRRMTFSDDTREHVFTFKQRLPNGQNLEIEVPIDEGQFNAAWDHTNERVVKRRITIEDDSHLRWDIDFYRWEHGQYFVLAEVEMPTQMERPKTILPDLEPYLVYEVPRSDDRFAAVRLADEAHACAMAIELGLIDADSALRVTSPIGDNVIQPTLVDRLRAALEPFCQELLDDVPDDHIVANLGTRFITCADIRRAIEIHNQAGF